MRVELFRALQGDFESCVVKMLKEMEDLTVSPEEVRYLAGILDQKRLRLVLNAIKIEDIRRKIAYYYPDLISYQEVDEHQEFLSSTIVCSATDPNSAIGLSVVSIDMGAHRATINLSLISFRMYSIRAIEYLDSQVIVDLKHINDVDELAYVYGRDEEKTPLFDVGRQLAVLRSVRNLKGVLRQFCSLEFPRNFDQLRPRYVWV